MNTIYTTNIVFYSFGDGPGELFRTISHEADEVDRRPGILRRKGDPLVGGDTIINGGSVTSTEVVNKYLPDNVVFTAPGMAHSPYISYNEEFMNKVHE